MQFWRGFTVKRIDKAYFEVTIPNQTGGDEETVTLTLSGISERQAMLIEKALQPGNRVLSPEELESMISGVALENVIRRNRRSTDPRD